MALTRRTWLRAAGIVPVVAVATIAGCGIAAALSHDPWSFAVVPAVLLVGLAVGMLLVRVAGADAAHRVVAAARADWARTRPGASVTRDGAPDPRDVALALPRGWRVETARGRVRFRVVDAEVQAETWVLRAAGGSRRAPRRREVVRVSARTGVARLWIPLGTSTDSMLVVPTWARDPDMVEPSWLATVQDRIARHEDLLGALTIGDDRVVLLAHDDPRSETMLARGQLVRDISAIIG